MRIRISARRAVGAVALVVALVLSAPITASASEHVPDTTPDGSLIVGTISPAKSERVTGTKAAELERIRLGEAEGQLLSPRTTHPACHGRTDYYRVQHTDSDGLGHYVDCFAYAGTYSYTMYGGRYLCPGNNVGRTFYWDPGTQAYYSSPWRGKTPHCYAFTAPWPTVLEVEIK